MTITLGLLSLATVALAYGALRLTRRAPEEPLGSCRCPHCEQKLRFRRQQVGRRMLCPRCVRVFTVPTAGQVAGWDQVMPQ